MELTKKCKKDFENWLLTNLSFVLKDEYLSLDRFNLFNNLTLYMKWGVYLEFFQSFGITISIIPESQKCWFVSFLGDDIMSTYFNLCDALEFESRSLAIAGAICKANEIYNELTNV